MPGELALATEAIGGLVGFGQTIGGLINAGKDNRRLDNLFKQRKAFQTPSEIFDIVNMSQSNAASGFSPQTLSYLTGQADAGLSASLGSATRLGADPNQISDILSRYYGDIFKIGNESELAKLKKVDSFTNALLLLSQNKEAEWASRDNLIKDQMQAAAAKVQADRQNITSGANLITNSLAAIGTSGLYDTTDPNAKDKKPVVTGTGSGGSR